MLCGEGSLVNYGDGKIRAITLFCRSWGCEHCAPARKRQLIQDAQAGLPVALLTLTTRHDPNGDPVAEAKRQGEAFGALILWLRRSHPKAQVEYFVVREATKKGWPHLHAVLRMPYVHWKRLRRKWLALTGSPGVDIRKIYNPAKCAKYVAKYIGKGTHKFGSAKRYWKSKGWIAPIEKERPVLDGYNWKWDVSHEPLNTFQQQYFLRRWFIIPSGNNDRFEAWDPKKWDPPPGYSGVGLSP